MSPGWRLGPFTYTDAVSEQPGGGGIDLLEFEDAPAPSRHRPEPRWGRRVVAVILGLLLLFAAAVGAYLLYLNHTASRNIKHENLLPTPDAALGTQQEALRSAGQNYLLIGSDARPGDTVSRSDVIIIAHVPDDKKKIYLVHFPRDLYVDVPGHGKDKINAAYAYGGAPLLVQTLQDLLQIRIDHVAKTDFDGFKNMTDVMGGVRVWADEPSGAKGKGEVAIQQGWNDLDGTQALGFVRERYQLSEGDISRGRRQMAFLKALILKAVTPEVILNPVKVAQLLDASTKNLVVDQDFTMDLMRSEAFSLRDIRSADVVFITAPFNGFGTAPNGGSIDILDEPGMQTLGDALRKGTMDSYTRVTTSP